MWCAGYLAASIQKTKTYQGWLANLAEPIMKGGDVLYGQNLMNTEQPVNIMYVIVLVPRAGSNLATFQTAFSEEETITLVADITKQHVHFAHGNREPLEIERIFSVNRRGITSLHTIEFKHGRLQLTHIPEQRVERTRNKEVGGSLNDGEQTGNN